MTNTDFWSPLHNSPFGAKIYDMITKSSLTIFWRGLDVRITSQYLPAIQFMLRLIAQLLRSSEIQLVEAEGWVGQLNL